MTRSPDVAPSGDPVTENREPLSGQVQHVVFHNEENGFAVLRVRMQGGRENVNVVGHIASVTPGEFVQASGSWEESPQHGRQFRAELLQVSPPTSVDGIEKYLGSGLIKGIGPETAKRMVKAFGEKVFEVIEEQPERLKTVEGIGRKRARQIVESYGEQKAVRDVMVFLQTYGVGPTRAVQVFRMYGADAVPLVSENPYRLAREIRGVGFRTADEIARRLGIPRDAMMRARAGLSWVLSEALSDGHCALPEETLLERATSLLAIGRDILTEALTEELAEERVVADQIDGRRAIFLPPLWDAERKIAERISSLRSQSPPWPRIDPDVALPWVEDRVGVRLAESQRRAVELALSSKVVVLTGGPGVGKTTLVSAILRILTAKGVEVELCAPTGRAAKRLTESLRERGLDSRLTAKTIHRLLESDPKVNGLFLRDEYRPLSCDLLVVDETSMVDVILMSALLRALPDGAALLLVGDVDQLPSVGPGQVLSDFIASGAVPVARLNEIFRQAAESRIIVNAHRVNAGEMPELEAPAAGESDFYFVPAHTPEDGVSKIVEIVKERIPRRFGLDPVRDVQVLSPMNRGELGARNLNLHLQSALNPWRAPEPTLERFGWTYRLSDKVMQMSNDYEKNVFNGDLGRIRRIDLEEETVVVDFDGRPVVYETRDLDQLAPAYATTIHKSQGSEFPAVVMTLAREHYVMLRRNLVYTAITRGKRLVVIVGQRQAFATAVSGARTRRRWSKLRERLVEMARASTAEV